MCEGGDYCESLYSDLEIRELDLEYIENYSRKRCMALLRATVVKQAKINKVSDVKLRDRLSKTNLPNECYRSRCAQTIDDCVSLIKDAESDKTKQNIITDIFTCLHELSLKEKKNRILDERKKHLSETIKTKAIAEITEKYDTKLKKILENSRPEKKRKRCDI